MFLRFDRLVSGFLSFNFCGVLILSLVLACCPRTGYGKDNKSSPKHLETLIPSSILLDGATYKREQLLYDFGQIAFSSFIQPNLFPERGLFNPFSNINGGKTDFNPYLFKKEYPWLYEYIFRDLGTPKYFALNKWQSPIRISLGYPNDLNPLRELKGKPVLSTRKYPRLTNDGEPMHEMFLSGPSLEEIPFRIRAEVSKSVLDVLPVLKEITNLPVAFIPPEQETLSNRGNLRIVLFHDVSEWETTFKKGNKVSYIQGLATGYDFRNDIEGEMLTTGVHFTPNMNRQVDGFFLADKSNEIELSICYLWDGHEPQLLSALVSECLLRSLGLPDASYRATNSMLNGWLQGKSNKPPAKISDYDKFIAKLLYDPRLKAGLSPSELFKFLSSLH